MKKVLRWIGISIVFLLYIGILFICENTWSAWGVLAVSVAICVWVFLKKKFRGKVLVILGICLLNIPAFALTNQISLAGAFIAKVCVPFVAPTFAEEMMKDKEESKVANDKYRDEKWEQDGYEREILQARKIRMEKIKPVGKESKKVILYLHGGAFVVGVKNSQRDLSVKLSEIAGGAVVYLPDYTTSDLAPYPVAFNDCVDSYKWLLEQGYDAQNIIIVGDSAGGNLALAVGLSLRDHKEPLPAGIITISAFANMKSDTDSYYRNADKCVLGPYFGGGKKYEQPFFYTEGMGKRLSDPYLSPVFGDYKDFPPLLMEVGSREIVLDDSVNIVNKVNQAGGHAQVKVYRGMWHVFQNIGMDFPEVKEAWNDIENFMKQVY